MKREEFLYLISAFKANYMNFGADKRALEVFYNGVKDIPYPVASKATEIIIKTEKYPPNVAVFREKALNIMWESLDPKDPLFFDKLTAVETAERTVESEKDNSYLLTCNDDY